jgi:hypothetical protein
MNAATRIVFNWLHKDPDLMETLVYTTERIYDPTELAENIEHFFREETNPLKDESHWIHYDLMEYVMDEVDWERLALELKIQTFEV